MAETVKVEGGHWQETEETVKKVVGWSQAEDRGDNDNGGVVTGRRQWNWWLTTCNTLGNW